MAGKFRHNRETGVEIINIYFVCIELAGTKTLIEGLRNGRAFEEIWSLPDCFTLSSGH